MHVYKHLGYSAVIWPEATYFAFLSHPIQFLSATHSSSQSSALFCIKEPTSGIKMKPSLKYCTTPPSFLSHPPSSLNSVRLLLSKPPSSPYQWYFPPHLFVSTVRRRTFIFWYWAAMRLTPVRLCLCSFITRPESRRRAFVLVEDSKHMRPVDLHGISHQLYLSNTQKCQLDPEQTHATLTWLKSSFHQQLRTAMEWLCVYYGLAEFGLEENTAVHLLCSAAVTPGMKAVSRQEGC